MRIYDSLPPRLEGRHAPNAVAIHCDNCNNDFLYPVGAGNLVTCPVCGTQETLAVDQAKPLQQVNIP